MVLGKFHGNRYDKNYATELKILVDTSHFKVTDTAWTAGLSEVITN